MKIAVIIAIIQAIIFAGHYFIYKTFVRFFGLADSGHLPWIRAVFVILSISFVLASVMAFLF